MDILINSQRAIIKFKLSRSLEILNGSISLNALSKISYQNLIKGCNCCYLGLCYLNSYYKNINTKKEPDHCKFYNPLKITNYDCIWVSIADSKASNNLFSEYCNYGNTTSEEIIKFKEFYERSYMKEAIYTFIELSKFEVSI